MRIRCSRSVPAEKIAVHPDNTVAEDAIELHHNAFARLAGRQRERPPIPADACLGKESADRFEAVVLHCRFVGVDERELDGPVVRQVHRSPVAIVEIETRRRGTDARLGEISVLAAEAEVVNGRGGIAEVKLPAEVEPVQLPPVSVCGNEQNEQQRGDATADHRTSLSTPGDHLTPFPIHKSARDRRFFLYVRVTVNSLPPFTRRS